jgi:hypothetical protein
MEKRKRLEYPSVVSAETSNPRSVHVYVPVTLSNLDSALALFSPIVPEIDQPILSPDVREILGPSYVPLSIRSWNLVQSSEDWSGCEAFQSCRFE